MNIPTLVTERLTLRAPRAEDHGIFARFMETGDTRFIGGPKAPHETWRYLCEVIGHWTMRGFGRWMVEAEGKPVGLVGLHEPLDWPETEIGWYVWAGLGKGYATEAGRAARSWAYGTLGLTTLISMISPGNEPSVRVAERLGATREPDYEHPRHGPLILYRHPGPEALA